MNHFGSCVVPCYTHADAVPLIGTNCLRYVSVTNRKFTAEKQKLEAKIQALAKERQEKAKSEADADEKDVVQGSKDQKRSEADKQETNEAIEIQK